MHYQSNIPKHSTTEHRRLSRCLVVFFVALSNISFKSGYQVLKRTAGSGRSISRNISQILRYLRVLRQLSSQAFIYSFLNKRYIADSDKSPNRLTILSDDNRAVTNLRDLRERFIGVAD